MIRQKYFLTLIISLCILAFVPQQPASADMAPKPGLSFEFIQEDGGTELAIVTAALYSCTKPDCSDASPHPTDERMGSYAFRCSERNCSVSTDALYFQLEVAFSDGVTRKSNIFSKTYYFASYRVTIRPDTLVVTELEGEDFNETLSWLKMLAPYLCPAVIVVVVIGLTLSLLAGKAGGDGEDELLTRVGGCLGWLAVGTFAITGLLMSWTTFLATLIIETIAAVAWFYFNSALPSLKKGLYAVTIANIFTQPVFVLALKQSFPFFGAPFGYVMIAVAEILIWMVETVIIYLMLPGKVNFKNVLSMTFIMNAASFGIGLLLPF